MLTIIAISLIKGGGTGFMWQLILTQLIFGTVFGFLVGFAGAFVAKHFKAATEGFECILFLAAALLAYGLPTMISGNGYLSVYIAPVPPPFISEMAIIVSIYEKGSLLPLSASSSGASPFLRFSFFERSTENTEAASVELITAPTRKLSPKPNSMISGNGYLSVYIAGIIIGNADIPQKTENTEAASVELITAPTRKLSPNPNLSTKKQKAAVTPAVITTPSVDRSPALTITGFAVSHLTENPPVNIIIISAVSQTFDAKL